MTPAEAKEMVDRGEAIVLDVVAPHVWPSMRRAIKGAVRIAPNEIGRRYTELPRERAILAYCT
jgi:hypothetical protein